jgi:two-component system sensor histidine kinase/response regulator
VTDTGIGFSEAERARLFEPFAQSCNAAAGAGGGTGLGLYIAKGLAEAMGGALDGESVPGAGSTFWFTASVGEDASAAGDAADEVGAETAETALSGHVLIVEDNGINQTLLAAYLERFGVGYDIAADGLQAVEAVRAGAYDVVLMDVMMPEVDGVEATRRIRALAGPKARVPIVALTANAMNGHREAYLAAGMDGYLSKPMEAGDLYRILARYLGSPPDAEAV